MTTAPDVNSLIYECADYTLKNSIGIITKRAARVVTVASLKQYLISQNISPKAVENIFKTRVKLGPIGDWTDWDYECCQVEDYRNDPRFNYRYFPELVDHKSNNTLLFVCYSKQNHLAYLNDISLNRKPVSSRKELSDELMDLYKVSYNTEH